MDGGGGEGGPDGPPSPCDIDETAIVGSPERTVVVTIRVQDVPNLGYDRGPPRLLPAVARSWAVLGSVTSASQARIVTCVDGGHHHAAEVTAIQGGRIHVRIRRS